MEKEKDGSYTVEAAFVVPILLGVAFTILYTLFLLHDQVMLQANLENAIFLAAESRKDSRQNLESDLGKSLWCMEITQAEVLNGAVWIRGNVTAGAKWQIPVLSYLIDERQTVSLSESYGNIQPEQSIRFGADVLKEKQED